MFITGVQPTKEELANNEAVKLFLYNVNLSDFQKKKLFQFYYNLCSVQTIDEVYESTKEHLLSIKK